MILNLPSEMVEVILRHLNKDLDLLRHDKTESYLYHQYYKDIRPDWVRDYPEKIEKIKSDIEKYEEWLELINNFKGD